MATYDFRKLGDVEALESVPENANALVEVGGAIKRVPGSNLGGGGIPTAMIRLDMGEASSVSVASLKEGRAGDAPHVYTATCDNMTYAEVKALMLAGKPVNMVLAVVLSEAYAEMYAFAPAATMGYYGFNNSTSQDSSPAPTELLGATFAFTAMNGQTVDYITLYWYEDGTITTELPA